MTADVVSLRRKPKLRAVVVNAAPLDETPVRSPHKRDLAIEHCADAIERALAQRLTYDQRIGLERALEALVDEIEWHKRDPWC